MIEYTRALLSLEYVCVALSYPRDFLDMTLWYNTVEKIMKIDWACTFAFKVPSSTTLLMFCYHNILQCPFFILNLVLQKNTGSHGKEEMYFRQVCFIYIFANIQLLH